MTAVEKIDRYLLRDAQRVIEAVETLVRIHTAQEEDIYDAVVALGNRRRWHAGEDSGRGNRLWPLVARCGAPIRERSTCYGLCMVAARRRGCQLLALRPCINVSGL
jgi:hypothetical protein